MSTALLDDLIWPISDIGTALEYLAVEAGLLDKATELPSPPEIASDSSPNLRRAMTSWLDSVSLRLGVEVESFHTSYSEVDSVLQQACPALLWIEQNTKVGCIAFVKRRGAGSFARAPRRGRAPGARAPS